MARKVYTIDIVGTSCEATILRGVRGRKLRQQVVRALSFDGADYISEGLSR